MLSTSAAATQGLPTLARAMPLQQFGELLEMLERRGLLAPDATFEEFEALMDRLEKSPPTQT